MNILSHLGTFRILGKKVSLETQSGLVIDQKEWVGRTDDHWSVQQSETHLLDFDGREFMWQLIQAPGIRPGHILTKFSSAHGNNFWGLYNHNLDEFQFSWQRISNDLAPSRKIFWALVLILTTASTYYAYQSSNLVSDWILTAIMVFFISYIALFIVFFIVRQTRKAVFKMRYKNNIVQTIRQNGSVIENQLIPLSDQYFGSE